MSFCISNYAQRIFLYWKTINTRILRNIILIQNIQPHAWQAASVTYNPKVESKNRTLDTMGSVRLLILMQPWAKVLQIKNPTTSEPTWALIPGPDRQSVSLPDFENIGGSISWHECHGWIVPLTWDPSFSLTSGKSKSQHLDWNFMSGCVQRQTNCLNPVSTFYFGQQTNKIKNMQLRHISLFSKQHHSQKTDASVRPRYFCVATYNSYIPWTLFIVRLNVHWGSSF